MFKPLADFILVEPAPIEAKVGAIILAEESMPKPTTGTIVAVGRSVEELQVGDKVVFGLYAGTEWSESMMADKKYRIMRESEVMGILPAIPETPNG